MMFDPQRPVATLADVKGWQDKKNEIEGRVAALQNELSDINKKLDAAAVLSPEAAQLRISTSAPTVRVSGNGSAATSEQETLTAAVVRIIGNSANPMTAKQLRKALTNEGYENSQIGNYLYTVFSRLVKRRQVVRHGGRYALPLSSVPEHQSHGAPSDVT